MAQMPQRFACLIGSRLTETPQSFGLILLCRTNPGIYGDMDGISSHGN
jgi:hypothetical protein